MADAYVPTRREFLFRVAGLTTAVSLAAVLLMVLYLLALLRLPAAQWSLFFRVVAACFVGLSLALFFWNRALFAPVLRYLEVRAAGDATPLVARSAYRRITRLPVLTFAMGQGWWLVGGLLVTGTMRLLDPGFELRSAAIMLAAASSGGLILMIFHYFLSKRQFAPLRLALARDLADPGEREAAIHSTAVRTKLLVSVGSVTLVLVVFSLFLAETLTRRPIHAWTSSVQGALLDEVASEGAGPGALRRAEERARRLGVADAVRVVRSPEEWRRLLPGIGNPLAAASASAGASAAERGDATAVDAERSFAWRRLPDGGVLVAVGPPLETDDQRGVFLAVGLLAILIASGVALVASNDIAASTSAISRAVARIARGDLSQRIDAEPDDELGSLIRDVEGMTGSLHAIVSQAAGTADALEAAARGLAEVGGSVTAVSRSQLEGLSQAVRSMETIREHVSGITTAAESLSESVEEASSSVLELGTAGDQLHETARTLSEKANSVSGSIDRLGESVRRVVESAEKLTAAADETASGAEQMATAMRQVDRGAGETARLSARVIEVAERGRDRVGRTVAGMDAIRGASDEVAVVIRGLGDQTQAIGSVVGVIDDIADETTLLALNAAIIAAQSGEQGRAFTVVADEIKELADRVLDNTKEISSMVANLQGEAGNASRAIVGGLESVKSGVQLADEAGVALEEITEVARRSGEHVRGIVAALQEQSSASGHIVSLMEIVRQGVEEIRRAGLEHERGNEVMRRGSVAMRDVADQVHETSREQARGAAMIVRSVERVREAVAEIHGALQQQAGATREAAEFLDRVHEHTRTHEESARTLGGATDELLRQAGDLRATIRRFSL